MDKFLHKNCFSCLISKSWNNEKGKEECPIPAVNSYDTSVPLIDYITDYSPQVGIYQ